MAQLRKLLPHHVVAVPNYEGMGSLGFIPTLQPPFKYILDIPGTPRLISRGKDSFLTNWLVDHFGLVFCTGPNNTPLPGDVAFDFSLGSNFNLRPMTYSEFPKKWGPVYLWNLKIDSKRKIIERLEDFYENPRKYSFWFFNCEDFSREMLTGVAQCLQREKFKENLDLFMEVAGQVLIKMAELEQQRVAAEKAKREAAAKAAAAQAQAATPPAPAVPTLPPMSPPQLGVMGIPPPKFKTMPPAGPMGPLVRKPATPASKTAKAAPKPRKKGH